MMFFMTRRILGLLLLGTVLALTAPAIAQSANASVKASLPTSSVHAGDKTTLSVATAVADSIHVQSRTPSDPKNDIAFEVTAAPDPKTVQYGPPIYPAGEDRVYGLGTVNSYEGTVVVKIPVTLSADLKPGPLMLKGTVHFQACNDQSCFPDETLPYEVKVDVVPARQTLQATTQTGPEAPKAAGPRTPRKVNTTVLGLDLKKSGLPAALAVAFVVGMIFNLMPCVLPVVPLKIMGFYESSQHNRARSFGLGVAFSAGMVASFTVLGLLIFVLHWINWGGLFQQTWFQIVIVAVLVAMAAGTYGLFSVGLPGNLYSFTPRHDTLTGNALFGVLTAALSTPCTFGMFFVMLTWLLSQPKWEGVVVMDAVGFGMAAPYLLLSGFPEVARRFPRTGPWAEVVKQFMAFLLLATAVYFAQPFFARVDAVHADWWLIFAVIAAGGIFLVIRGIQFHKSAVAIVVTSVLAVLIVAPSAYATHRLTIEPYAWEPYSDKTLAAALASGRPVVVDFTAAWCGNCHWIEAHTLPDGSVIRAVHDRNALMLRADIDRSPDAKAKLLSLEATGAIPLTAVYLPGQGEPSLLDGLYSATELSDAIREK
jgi:suppressor for copper-sensitivity B